MTVLSLKYRRRVRASTVFIFCLLSGLSGLGDGAVGAPAKPRPAPVVNGTPMVYFRVSSLDQCNVYMNYSYFDEPKFQLRVLNPAVLSQAQARFVETFNAAFAVMIHNHPDACSYQGSAYAMSGQTQQTVLQRCLAQEQTMGYSEGGWQGGPLPAPSNCISYRDSAPGVIDLLPRTLPYERLSVEAWMRRANARH